MFAAKVLACLCLAQDVAPVPDPGAQKKAEAEIRELFKADFARKDREGRRALSETLLKQEAETQDDPAARFVLLREAREAAVEALDLPAAMAAIDRAAAVFAVDARALRAAATAAVRKQVRTVEDALSVAGDVSSLAERAAEGDDYPTARALLKDAEQLARLGKDAGLAARTAERAKEVADLAAEHEKFLKAESALAAQPLDPDASLVYGRYLCFVKGRWEKGAPYLARGADAALAEVAQKELVPQAFPEDQAALGDAWWSLAEKTKPAVDKKRYQRRGYEWYETALKSATGLARSRIQQRMQAMEKDLSPKGLVDLLRMIDVKKDAVTDAWTLQRSALVSPATAGPRLMIPYQPPDEYDLKIVAENRTPEVRGALFVGLVVADKQMAAGLDLLEGFTASCLEVAGPNETVHKGKVFVDDRPRTVLCSVRRAKVTVTVDGKTVLDWKVDPKRIVEAALPQKKSLWLGAHFGAFHVTQMTLVHVSGLGKPLR